MLADSRGLGRNQGWSLRIMTLPMIGGLFFTPTRKSVEQTLRFVVHRREHIPNARLKIMPECGHIPFWENPDEFNHEVLE